MEETFRVRPCTPRVAEKKLEYLEDIHDPIKILNTLTGFTPLEFNKLIKLEFQIDTETIELHKFGNICPNVTELKLNGSSIDSLRTLGTG